MGVDHLRNLEPSALMPRQYHRPTPPTWLAVRVQDLIAECIAESGGKRTVGLELAKSRLRIGYKATVRISRGLPVNQATITAAKVALGELGEERNR